MKNLNSFGTAPVNCDTIESNTEICVTNNKSIFICNNIQYDILAKAYLLNIVKIKIFSKSRKKNDKKFLICKQELAVHVSSSTPLIAECKNKEEAMGLLHKNLNAILIHLYKEIDSDWVVLRSKLFYETEAALEDVLGLGYFKEENTQLYVSNFIYNLTAEENMDSYGWQKKELM